MALDRNRQPEQRMLRGGGAGPALPAPVTDSSRGHQNYSGQWVVGNGREIMERVKSYKDLEVWKRSIAMAECIYSATKNFPEKENFSLTSQMRRAAVSVPSNLAEGPARKHTKEFVQFIHHSLGSLAELDTQTIIACRVGYLKDSESAAISAELRKMMYGLINKLDPENSVH